MTERLALETGSAAMQAADAEGCWVTFAVKVQLSEGLGRDLEQNKPVKVGLREDSARAGGAVGHQFGFELRSIWEEKRSWDGS